MKGGGKSSKAKGSSFERDTCKKLSLWVSRRLRDDLFWRSAMSGGRASVKFKGGGRNTTQVGDISAIDPQGARLTDIHVIECKHVKNLDLGFQTIGGYGHLYKFWATLLREAHRINKRGLLIARQNQQPTIICMTQQSVHDFGLHHPAMAIYFDSMAVMTMYIYVFDDFLKQATRP